MKKLSLLIAGLLAAADVSAAVSFPTWQGNAPPASVHFYCLPAAPTVPVDVYVAPTLVDPTSNGATTIEQTDGTYYYITTVSSGTGYLSSLFSCPVRYTTKQ